MNELTLEELKQMSGQPVWCKSLEVYGIIKCESIGRWKGIPFLVGIFYSSEYGTAPNFEYDIQKRGLTCCSVINEKQIPKKPKNMKSIFDFSGRYYTTKGECPTCSAEGVYRSSLYCNKCGQKLDWE
ncbi:hypothetical protein DXC87_02190 [Blautia obeum]|jgi:hypothetical protein|uniref:hypothetical protein n=1 Tax=Blautia obeum TaxID=40520 RepID=UPI000E42F127|nr:hypothetical protein [Blautia obeum]RGK95245.1 hypothetical protein DXC87_02190 [Blautia obeum]